MFNSTILTLFSVIFTTTIFSQAITLNGAVINPTTGASTSCTANSYQTVNNATSNGTCINLNSSGNFNNGAVWVCNTIDLNQTFKLNFSANFGSDIATGDGIAFLLQQEGVPNVIGGTGGGMGYSPGNPINCQGGACPIEPSVAVEFDTYDGSSFGDNDLNCNHSSIQVDGQTNLAGTIAGPSCLLPSSGTVVDGLNHDICITWNPFSLQYNVYFDDTQILAYNGDIRTNFNSPYNVFWGFTASSGGASQIHQVCNIEMLTGVSNPTCICTTPNLIITDPAPFCGIGNITDAPITAGSDLGTLTYWNNALCTNPVTNPNALFNTGVFYIQLETAPGCITSEAVNLAVNNSITPTFGAIPFICVGEPIILPSNSLEGVTGTWSPAPNNTVTTTYTFTPNSGECANSTATATVQVRPAPTIEPIANLSICNGDITNFNAVVSGLGTTLEWTSLDGTFSNPTGLSTSFTPSITSGLAIVTAIASSPICSITAQEIITVTINANNLTPSFTPIPDICSGGLFTLSPTSNNGITGTWSPAVNNTASTNYTFTPDAGQCATTETMTVNVNAQTTPSFTAIADICSGSSLSLPGSSTNSISGTWSPAVNNTASTNYTFTPDAGQCATTETMTVNVNAQTTPSFTAIADICSGSSLSLPGSSTNSISGTWSPAVNNTASTNYTFTPDAGQCATTETMTVNVNDLPSFTSELGNDPLNCGGLDGSILLSGLSASSSYDFTYNDGSSNVGPLSITTDASGSYILSSISAGSYSSFMITDGNCSYTVVPSVTLVDPSAPVFTANSVGDPSTCLGDDGMIDLTGLLSNTTYALTYLDDGVSVGPINVTSDGSGNIALNSLDAGTYTSFVMNLAGCTGSTGSSISLTDPTSPVLQLTDPSAVCSPLTVDLSAPDLTTGSTGGGALTYWTDAAATVSLVDPTALSTSGMYYIQSQSNGCTDIASVNVTINETPILLLTDPSAVCSPLTVDLSAPDLTTGSTGGGTLTYWTDAAATVSLVDPTALSTSGMYYIQSQSNGCTDIASVNVTINETPVLLLTDPSAVCSPLTVDLSAPDLTTGSTGGGTLTYWTDAAATVSLVDPTALSTSGMYYIQSQSNGCTDIASVNVTVNPTPSFSVYGTDPTVCNASDGVITISGLEPLTNYILAYDSLATVSQVATITTDATGGFTINGFQAGLYEAFSIALNGCEFTATENIDLNNPLAPSVDVQVDNTVCDSYTLEGITGNNLSGNEAYYSQSNGAGETWSPGDVITASQTVYIYDVIGACSDETSFSLTVNITPVITNLSAQQACESYMLPVNINGADLSGSQNYYNDTQENGGTAITNPITSSQTVYMFDANGLCRDEVSFEVSIYDLPQVLSFSGEGTYCEGEVVGNLTAEVSGVGTYTIDYTLDGNLSIANTAATAVDLGNEAGVYVLTAISDDHCNNNVDLTQTITINALPDAPVVSEDAQYCSNEQAVPMEAQGSSGTYTWYSDNNLTNVLTIQESYTPSNTIGSTNYYVTATENGCQGPAQMITIDFLECGITIPTAFTPDGDNVNDFWKINDLDAIYPNNVVHVYNRLGNQIYESMEGGYNQMPWDGRFENQDLPVASYYYIIEYNDGVTKKTSGNVSIIK